MNSEYKLYMDRIVINYIYNSCCEHTDSNILFEIIKRTLKEEKLNNRIILDIPVSQYEAEEIKVKFPMIPSWSIYQK